MRKANCRTIKTRSDFFYKLCRRPALKGCMSGGRYKSARTRAYLAKGTAVIRQKRVPSNTAEYSGRRVMRDRRIPKDRGVKGFVRQDLGNQPRRRYVPED